MICGTCDTPNPSHHRFCFECGARLTTVNSTPGTPTPLFPELLTELKQVSVLFVDITNSVRLIHRLNPEESTEIIEPVMADLKSAAHQFGGVINRVDGDGMMVLFGAPVAFEDHAVRATYAALEMIRYITLRDDKVPIVQIRIGIHSGDVLLKPYFNDFSVDYEALGPTVYLAHRMETLASPNSAVVSQETYLLCRKHIKTIDLGPTHVKGIDSPLVIHQIVGKTAHTTLNDLSLYRNDCFIGRRSELTRAEYQLEQLTRGEGGLMLVRGEAGIGKSRFLRRILQHPAMDIILRLESACDSHNRATSYLGFINLLRYWLDIQESDRQMEIAQKLRDRLSRMNHELHEHISAFHALLSLPIQNQAWSELDPFQKRLRLFAAIRSLLVDLASRQPLMLVIEDLHWADLDTRDAFKEFIEGIAQHPILVCATLRPEIREDWIRSLGGHIIDMLPLTRDETDELLTQTLGEANSIRPIRAAIAERCQGVPLYAEEMIQHLRDSHLIWGASGHYQSSLQQFPERLPNSISAVIAGRVDRRSKVAKQMVQAAAVLGEKFSVNVISRMIDCSDYQREYGIRELTEAEFIQPLATRLEHEYQFKHALIHQVVYDSLPRERKIHLHSRAASAIESLYEERVDEYLYLLADHSLKGQLWEKAANFYLKACYHALGRSSFHQAVLMLDKGLESLDHLPGSKQTLSQRIDFLLVGLNALIPLGEQERLVNDLLHAKQLGESLDDTKRLCSILCQLTNALWMVGRHQEALTSSMEAVERADQLQIVPMQVAAHYNRGMVFHALGRFEDTVHEAEVILRLLGTELEFKRMGWAGLPSVFARTFLGNSLVELGRFDEAYTAIARGVQVAEQANQPYSLAMIYDTLGYYFLHTGEFAKARQVLEKALAISRQNAVLTMIPAIAAKLGTACCELDDLQAAGDVLEQAIRPEVYTKGGRYTWFYLFSAMADYLRQNGNSRRAVYFARRAYQITKATSEHSHHCYATLCLSRTCMERYPKRAALLLEEAAGLAQRHRLTRLKQIIEKAGKDFSIQYLPMQHNADASAFIQSPPPVMASPLGSPLAPSDAIAALPFVSG